MPIKELSNVSQTCHWILWVIFCSQPAHPELWSLTGTEMRRWKTSNGMSGREVFVLPYAWGQLHWIERSEHMAWHSMRRPSNQFFSIFYFFIMAEWAVLSCCQRNAGIPWVAEGKKIKKSLNAGSSREVPMLFPNSLPCFSSLSSTSLCFWRWSKQEPPRRRNED